MLGLKLNKWSFSAQMHQCVLCSLPCLPEEHLCPACLEQLPWNYLQCKKCAHPLTLGNKACNYCKGRRFAFDSVYAPLEYRSSVAKLIKAYKYHTKLQLLPLLVNLLMSELPRLQEQHRIEGLLPMPLTRLRFRERHFNQAQLLAQQLSKHLELPLIANRVERIKHSPKLAQSSSRQRWRHSRNAFKVVNTITAKRIAIVDDVLTTGASADSLARCLKRSGVEHVSVWCVARSVFKENFKC